MVELISDLNADTVRANLAEVREEIATAATSAGRDPGEVEVLAATKYVAVDDLPVLAEAGVGLVGENRAQDLAAKVAAHGELFTWDFIGRLQSRKIKAIVVAWPRPPKRGVTLEPQTACHVDALGRRAEPLRLSDPSRS